MRNRNMSNDKVVRAIALALSSVLASGAVMPAMTAYAAEDVVVETVEEATEVEEVIVGAAEAKEAIAEAVVSENVVAKEAHAVIGSNILTQETMAAFADVAAAGKVESAEGIIEKAEGKVDKKLSDIDTQEDKLDAAAEAVDQAVENVNEAVDTTSSELGIAVEEAGKVEAAKTDAKAAADAAAKASSSSVAEENAKKADAAVKAAEDAKDAADEAAAKAGEAANTADEEADTAEAEAANALLAYQAAEADYQKALEIAEKAEAEANRKIAEGAADAEVAAKYAKNAWDTAKLLKGIAEDNKKKADEKVRTAKSELDKAQKELKQAEDDYNEAVEAVDKATKDESKASNTLKSAQDALDKAQKLVDGLQKNIDAKQLDIDGYKKSISELEIAKSKLEADKKAAEDELKKLEKEKGKADREYKEKENEYKSISKAVYGALKTINSQLETARTELKQLTTDEGNQRQLVADEKAKYIYTDEDDVEHITAMGEIYMIEKEIASIVADEKMTDEDKASAINNKRDELVKVVLGQEKGATNVYEVETSGLSNNDNVTVTVSGDIKNTIYAVTETVVDEEGNEATKVVYYTYEVEEDGSIKVYDLVRTEVVSNTYKTVKESQTNLTQDEFDALVEGLVEGDDYTVEVTEHDGSPATYYVSYNKVVVEEYDRWSIKHDYINGLIADGVKVTVDGNVITKVEKRFYHGSLDYRTAYKVNGTWVFIQADQVLRCEKVDNNVTTDVLTQDQIDALTGVENLKISLKEEAVEASKTYSVVIYNSYTESISAEAAEAYGLDENGEYRSEDGSVVIIRTKDAQEKESHEETVTTYIVVEELKSSEKHTFDEIDKTLVDAGYVYSGNNQVVYDEIQKGYGYYTGNGRKWHSVYDTNKVYDVRAKVVSKTTEKSETDKYKGKKYKKYTNSETIEVVDQAASPAEYKMITYTMQRDKTISYDYADEFSDADATKGYYGDLAAKEAELARLSGAVEEAQAKVNGLIANKDAQKTKLSNAKTAKDDAAKEVERLAGLIKEKNDEISGLKKDIDNKKGDIKKLTDKKDKAEKELKKLQDQMKDADKDLKKKTNDVTKAQKKYDDAKAKLDTAKWNLILAEKNKNAKTANVNGKKINLAKAENAQETAKKQLKFYVKLESEAKKAYDAAKNAEDLLKNLKGSADVSSKELAAAKQKVAELKQKYEDAKAAADKARENADKALQDYQDALVEVAKLAGLVDDAKASAGEAWSAVEAKRLAEEEAARLAREAANSGDSSSSSSSNREVAVISQGVAGQPTLATNPAGRTVRRNTTVAAAVEEVVAGDGEIEETAGGSTVLEDNEVPMADKQSVTIDDNETALSASIPVQEKMSWWWLILVIIAGGTGLEMYLRHKVKKNAEAETNND